MFVTTFGEQLRAQIEFAGTTQGKVAAQIGWSPSMVSALVTGRRRPRREHVEALDSVLGAGGILVRRWAEEKRREAEPDWLRRVDDVDADAVEMRIAHPVVLPAVAQSRCYALGVLRRGRPLDTEGQLEAAADRRMERQERLLRPDGPQVSIVVPGRVVEDAVRLAPDAVPHLLQVAESACVQIISETDGCDLAAATGAFRLMNFLDRQPLIFAESAIGGSLIDHPQTVARFVAVASQLQAWAMSPGQSIRYLKGLL